MCISRTSPTRSGRHLDTGRARLSARGVEAAHVSTPASRTRRVLCGVLSGAEPQVATALAVHRGDAARALPPDRCAHALRGRDRRRDRANATRHPRSEGALRLARVADASGGIPRGAGLARPRDEPAGKAGRDRADLCEAAVHPHLVRPAVRPTADRRSRSRSAQATLKEEMVATFPIVIEDMTAEDIPAVQEVERASFPVPWPANAFKHELTQNKNARYIVARESERIIAYAGLWLALDEAHIPTFAVIPERRRRRIGERMLVRLFDLATELQAEWLTLEVRASNFPAQRLYEKYGFHAAGIRRHYYSDNNEDAIIMWTERLRDRAVRERLAKLRAEFEEG